MIRKCDDKDISEIFAIINDAASAYKGVIPDDRTGDPYMPETELRAEIADGVEFWGYEAGGRLLGVMGIQDKGDLALIRHAYTRSSERGKGIGSALLKHLESGVSKPVLIGTWRAAAWAVSFYEKHGYRLLSDSETPALLRKYWGVPERQIETSVVLAGRKWFSSRKE